LCIGLYDCGDVGERLMCENMLEKVIMKTMEKEGF
jgi:hypothetical protein